MPSGKSHLRVELMLWLPLTGCYYYLLDAAQVELALFAASYFLASIYLSPDLDLHKNSAKRRWGPLGFIWTPYSHLFKHRGLSHSMIFGPLTRLIYLGLVIGAVSYGLGYAGIVLTVSDFDWLTENVILALAMGLYLPNVLHVLVDRSASLFKSLVFRRRKIFYSG